MKPPHPRLGRMPKTKVRINRSEDITDHRRRHGVNLRSRLLCPVCQEVTPVEAIDDDMLITLSCGHQRGELLPVREGCLSLEHMRTKKGQQVFPATNAGEFTTLPEWVENRPRN
jgi:hypothetical protein